MASSWCVHRAAEILGYLEKKLTVGQKEVSKVMSNKKVKVGEDVALWTIKGQVRFSSFATNRYDKEDLELARGFAESD